MIQITSCPICGNSSLSNYHHCIDHSVSRESFSLDICPNCRLLITNPHPEKEALQKYYQFEDYISHTNQANNLVNKIYVIARRYTLHQKLKLIQQYSKKGKLLDVGCGTGSFLQFCKKHEWSVQGIEPSETAATIARQTNITVVPSINQNTTSGFNVITLWHVLEHLPLLNESVDEIKNKIDEHGTIFIAIPNFESYDAEHYKDIWAAYDVPRHLWHFSKLAMVQLLKKHALKLIAVKPMKLDAYYVSLLSEKYKRNNQSSFGSFLNALRIGFVSNLKARKNLNYSSLIYIVRK